MEPLPRDGGVRGRRMSRPVYVARDASQQDARYKTTISNVVPRPRDHFHFNLYIKRCNSRLEVPCFVTPLPSI